jgi:hypothetical protein
MTTEICLNYPHDARTLQPMQLRSSEIALLALEVRSQLVSSRTVKLDLATMMRASRQMHVNGHSFDSHWELRDELLGEQGIPAFGLVDFDRELPRTAMVFLDEKEVAARDYLARSTAAHELAHLIFDAPWRLRHIQRTGDLPAEHQRRLMLPKDRARPRTGPEWEEWRANEFMGAFLAPMRLLHSQMLQVCAGIRVPRRANAFGRLVIDGRKVDRDVIQLVIDEVAERFGLSSDFIDYRFRRYQLVQPEPGPIHA